MTAVIQFTPLYGVHDSNPLCYLLEIDDFRILLDCGWDERFDVEMLAPLAEYVVLLFNASLTWCC